MSPPGRHKGEYRSAQHEGTPVSQRRMGVKYEWTMMFSRHVGMLLGCMRSEGGTGSGEDARASARRAPAG